MKDGCCSTSSHRVEEEIVCKFTFAKLNTIQFMDFVFVLVQIFEKFGKVAVVFPKLPGDFIDISARSLSFYLSYQL